jgi:hypothetical protein
MNDIYDLDFVIFVLEKDGYRKHLNCFLFSSLHTFLLDLRGEPVSLPVVRYLLYTFFFFPTIRFGEVDN